MITTNNNKQKIVVGIRMTPAEASLIDQLAKNDYRTRSEYLRMLIFTNLKEVAE